jgi:hypothetical protein
MIETPDKPDVEKKQNGIVPQSQPPIYNFQWVADMAD